MVHHEVVEEGQRLHSCGVQQVEEALEAGWLRVMHPIRAETRTAERLLRTTRLDEGEAEAVAIRSASQAPSDC